MTRTTVLLILAVLLAGCSGATRLDLTSWGRAIWQRPEDVVRTLELPAGASVADIGAGEGYFVPHLADAVGKDGRVYAVEVEAELTEALESRFTEAPNVEVVLGDFDDPLLPDGEIDLVLIVNTYHHIEDRERYFRKLLIDLSPEGRVAVIEPNAELTGILALFVEDGHGSRASDVEREMREAGYRRLESVDLLPIQIFEVFGARTVLAADQAPACVYLARVTDQDPNPELQSHGACAAIQPDDSPRIHPDHLAAIDFRDDVAPVLVGDRWYYVAPDGRTAAVVLFNNGADRFCEGLARTSVSGRIGYIDRSLRVVIPLRYDFAWPFENGRALVCQGCKPGEPDSDGHTTVIGGQWGYIDRDGRTVVPIRLTRDEALAVGSR